MDCWYDYVISAFILGLCLFIFVFNIIANRKRRREINKYLHGDD